MTLLQWSLFLFLLLFLFRTCFTFLHAFSATQCFSRVIPKTPLHSLTTVPSLPSSAFNHSHFQAKHQLPGVPLIVRGHGQHQKWPAMTLWQDVNYFSKCASNFTETIHGLSLTDYITYMADLEQQLAANPHAYANVTLTQQLGELYWKHNEALFYQCPALWEDVLGFSTARQHASKPNTLLANMARWVITLFEVQFLPADFVWGDWVQAVFWLGFPGSQTLLHYDDDPLSLLYQIRGSKEIRIWSPDQSKFLYPHDHCKSLDEYGTRFSQFKGDPTSMSEKELRVFPMIPKAEYLDITLHPGDMVFIPSGWWHYVKVFKGSDEMSVSVAARSYSTCEGISYLPNFVINWIHSTFEGIDMRGFCIRPSYV